MGNANQEFEEFRENRLKEEKDYLVRAVLALDSVGHGVDEHGRDYVTFVVKDSAARDELFDAVRRISEMIMDEAKAGK